MKIDALAPSIRLTFQRLKGLSEIKLFYLAGGSAVALHLGHRFSNDLDFFSEQKFNSIVLSKDLQAIGTLKTVTLEEDTLLGTLNDVKISFFYLPYKSLFRSINFQGIKISDLRDLAVMKLQAIGSRGTRRDFVDLYVILQAKKWGVGQIFKWHHKKYAGADVSPIFLLKSLIYFEDADSDQPLKMISPVGWEMVKKYFHKIVHEVKL